MNFDEKDCRIDSLDQRKKGGQHVGSVNAAVKVTHIPSGITATVEARSQHKARTIAMEMVEYGLTYSRDLM